MRSFFDFLDETATVELALSNDGSKSLLLRNGKFRTRKRNLKNGLHIVQWISHLIRMNKPRNLRFHTCGRNTVKKKLSLFKIISASFSVSNIPHKTTEDPAAFRVLQTKRYLTVALFGNKIRFHYSVQHFCHSAVKQRIIQFLNKRVKSHAQFFTQFRTAPELRRILSDIRIIVVIPYFVTVKPACLPYDVLTVQLIIRKAAELAGN